MTQVTAPILDSTNSGSRSYRSNLTVRALLASGALLVKIKRDLENQVRGILKNLGLVIGRATFNVFAVRAEEQIEGRPELIAAVRPLLEARRAIEQQVGNLDRKVLKLARYDVQVPWRVSFASNRYRIAAS